MGKMTKQDREEWNELYEYVKVYILNYPKEKSLPKILILRLKGLKDGKFIANKHTQSKGDYSFNIILLTFKICKMNIINALGDKSKFKNEVHMINYIMTIVENKINDVFDMVNSKKKADEMVDKVSLNNSNINNIYIKKTSEIKNERLKSLW